mgnify:CR=1 FL=1
MPLIAPAPYVASLSYFPLMLLSHTSLSCFPLMLPSPAFLLILPSYFPLTSLSLPFHTSLSFFLLFVTETMRAAPRCERDTPQAAPEQLCEPPSTPINVSWSSYRHSILE